ncbi:MAG: amidohydrolase family protein [bacterium]|nr:amidohydrolase family protein [bacterium]
MRIHARTWTGIASAEQLVIETDGERIVSVRPDLAAARRGDAVVCPAGSLLVPGLHDAHCHLLEGGLMMAECDFDGADALEQVGKALRDYVCAQGGSAAEWVLGRRLDETRVRVTRHDLDRACADRPVFVWTHDLHSAVVNSAALERAQISDDAVNPPGGRFERDEHGRITGVLRETAAHRVVERIAPPSAEQFRQALLRAQTYAFSLGITAVSSSVRGDMLASYRAFAESTERDLRMNIWPVCEEFQLDGERFETVNESGYPIGTLKGFVDGAL